MKKPNFFIIGAPKCGTTSLAAWLGEHPQVYMSNPKEPSYFNSDILFRSTDILSEYEVIFESVQPSHIAVGEASTSYLYSREAVPNILAYSPNAKFIVMLRKPQEMVVSLHATECGGREDVRDFETAWRLQSERAQGRRLPLFPRCYGELQYGERCRIGTQLARVLDRVPRDRVLIIFLEDLRRNPAIEYDRALCFLDVEPFRPAEFRTENARRHLRSILFKRILIALGHVKRMSGLNGATGLLAPLHRLNERIPDRPTEISGDLKGELDVYFREEIATVQRLIGRVPDEWLS